MRTNLIYSKFGEEAIGPGPNLMNFFFSRLRCAQLLLFASSCWNCAKCNRTLASSGASNSAFCNTSYARMRFLKCANLNEFIVPKPTQEAWSPLHPPQIDEIHVRQMQATLHFTAKPCFSCLGCSKSHNLHSGSCGAAKKVCFSPAWRCMFSWFTAKPN